MNYEEEQAAIWREEERKKQEYRFFEARLSFTNRETPACEACETTNRPRMMWHTGYLCDRCGWDSLGVVATVSLHIGELQSQLDHMRWGYKENHPDYKKIESRIHDMREWLKR